MATEINLLPWRDALRQRQDRHFRMLMITMVLLGVGGGWGLSCWQQNKLEAQDQRNRYIQTQAQQLDHEIQAAEHNQVLIGELLARIERIQEWLSHRTQTVRIFSHLVTSLEDGVYYLRLSRKDNLFHITGMAETSRQVTNQLRALAAGDVFFVPVLSEVQAQEQWRRFDMSVRAIMSPIDSLDGRERPDES